MSNMRPYVVKQGDYLSSIADRFGFDPMEVWENEKNEGLRKKRKNPDILHPGDLLFIPDEDPEECNLVAGADNAYVAEEILIKVKFLGPPDQAFRIEGLDPPKEGQAGGDGVVELEVPTSIHFLWVHYPALKLVFPLQIGHMDPVHKPSGIQGRLDNLGHGRTLLTGLVENMRGGTLNSEELLSGSIAQFQARHDLPVTGERDLPTIRKLEEVYKA
jgi:hypothetical protein